jgi:farnesyl diphosphate synthase
LAPTEQQAFLNALETTAQATATTLEALIGPDQGRLTEAMRYAVLNGGKRLRPFLVCETAAMFDVDRTQALRAAAAIECVHCYSLVHDDLPAMDDDDLRRGQPTVHRKFDEATAILAGDALLTLAFEILAAPETHPDPAIRCELVAALALASGKDGMVQGQMLDIAAETQGFSSVDQIAAMQSLKTGALFRFACEAGAIMAKADRKPFRQYADKIGLAFQITDDILDVNSTPEALGKATQKDKGRGKATFVDLLGMAGAKTRANELVGEAKEALKQFGNRAHHLTAVADFIVNRKR